MQTSLPPWLGGTASSDDETKKLQDEIKQLKKANEKMKKTVCRVIDLLMFLS